MFHRVVRFFILVLVSTSLVVSSVYAGPEGEEDSVTEGSTLQQNQIGGFFYNDTFVESPYLQDSTARWFVYDLATDWSLSRTAENAFNFVSGAGQLVWQPLCAIHDGFLTVYVKVNNAVSETQVSLEDVPYSGYFARSTQEKILAKQYTGWDLAKDEGYAVLVIGTFGAAHVAHESYDTGKTAFGFDESVSARQARERLWGTVGGQVGILAVAKVRAGLSRQFTEEDCAELLRLIESEQRARSGFSGGVRETAPQPAPGATPLEVVGEAPIGSRTDAGMTGTDGLFKAAGDASPPPAPKGSGTTGEGLPCQEPPAAVEGTPAVQGLTVAPSSEKAPLCLS
ncbi:MAG: hypothetical protein HY390_06120 [Deltaproteobacteria bacterium]|nr:hypothetical protein [Deltaproteobacteria bacterium]